MLTNYCEYELSQSLVYAPSTYYCLKALSVHLNNLKQCLYDLGENQGAKNNKNKPHVYLIYSYY